MRRSRQSTTLVALGALLVALVAVLWLGNREEDPAPVDTSNEGDTADPGVSLEARGQEAPPPREPESSETEVDAEPLGDTQAYRGRLIDEAGAALPGIRVYLRWDGGANGFGAVNDSGEDGRFEIPLTGEGIVGATNADGALKNYVLHLLRPGFTYEPVRAHRDGLGPGHVIRVDQTGQKLALHITRVDGSAAVGASVTLSPLWRTVVRGEPPPRSTATVNEDGLAHPQWPAWHTGQLAQVTDGDSPPRYFVLELTRVRATQPYPLVLGRAEHRLTVTVLDVGGDRLPGTLVDLRVPLAGTSSSAHLAGKTDEEGQVAWVIADCEDLRFGQTKYGTIAEVWYTDAARRMRYAEVETKINFGAGDAVAVLQVPAEEMQPEVAPIWVRISTEALARHGHPVEMQVAWNEGSARRLTLGGKVGAHAPLPAPDGSALWPMVYVLPPDAEDISDCVAWLRFDSGVVRTVPVDAAAWRASLDSRTPLTLAPTFGSLTDLAVRVVSSDGTGAPHAAVAVSSHQTHWPVYSVGLRRTTSDESGLARFREFEAGGRWTIWAQSHDGRGRAATDLVTAEKQGPVELVLKPAEPFSATFILPDGTIPQNATCFLKPRYAAMARWRQASFDPATGRVAFDGAHHDLFKLEIGLVANRVRYLLRAPLNELHGRTVEIPPFVLPGVTPAPANK